MDFDKVWKMDELLGRLDVIGRKRARRPHQSKRELDRRLRHGRENYHDIKITPYQEGAFEGNFIHGRRYQMHGRVITRRTFISMRKRAWKDRYSAKGQAGQLRAARAAAAAEAAAAREAANAQ